MTAKTSDQPAKPAKRTAVTRTAKPPEGFTDDERAAMKERARELKGAARRSPRVARADGESEVLAKLAEMPEPDRVLGERLHVLMTSCAPDLAAKAVVRHARLRPGRQGGLLFPGGAQIQDEVLDAGLQRRGKA